MASPTPTATSYPQDATPDSDEGQASIPSPLLEDKAASPNENGTSEADVAGSGVVVNDTTSSSSTTPATTIITEPPLNKEAIPLLVEEEGGVLVSTGTPSLTIDTSAEFVDRIGNEILIDDGYQTTVQSDPMSNLNSRKSELEALRSKGLAQSLRNELKNAALMSSKAIEDKQFEIEQYRAHHQSLVLTPRMTEGIGDESGDKSLYTVSEIEKFYLSQRSRDKEMRRHRRDALENLHSFSGVYQHVDMTKMSDFFDTPTADGLLPDETSGEVAGPPIKFSDLVHIEEGFERDDDDDDDDNSIGINEIGNYSDLDDAKNGSDGANNDGKADQEDTEDGPKEASKTDIGEADENLVDDTTKIMDPIADTDETGAGADANIDKPGVGGVDLDDDTEAHIGAINDSDICAPNIDTENLTERQADEVKVDSNGAVDIEKSVADGDRTDIKEENDSERIEDAHVSSPSQDEVVPGGENSVTGDADTDHSLPALPNDEKEDASNEEDPTYGNGVAGTIDHEKGAATTDGNSSEKQNASTAINKILASDDSFVAVDGIEGSTAIEDAPESSAATSSAEKGMDILPLGTGDKEERNENNEKEVRIDGNDTELEITNELRDGKSMLDKEQLVARDDVDPSLDENLDETLVSSNKSEVRTVGAVGKPREFVFDEDVVEKRLDEDKSGTSAVEESMLRKEEELAAEYEEKVSQALLQRFSHEQDYSEGAPNLPKIVAPAASLKAFQRAIMKAHSVATGHTSPKEVRPPAQSPRENLPPVPKKKSPKAQQSAQNTAPEKQKPKTPRAQNSLEEASLQARPKRSHSPKRSHRRTSSLPKTLVTPAEKTTREVPASAPPPRRKRGCSVPRSVRKKTPGRRRGSSVEAKGKAKSTPAPAAKKKTVSLYKGRAPVARPQADLKWNPQAKCIEKWNPNLHSSRMGCERCLFFAGEEEKRMFYLQGHHHRINLVRGGCGRSCTYFPRKMDENPVRLCHKCFYDTHELVLW